MKNLFLFLMVIILGLGRAKAQDSWISYKIDDKLAVKFPKQPNISGDKSFIFIKDDDSTVYALAIVDAKTHSVDSAAFASYSLTKQFADSFKNGLLGGMPGSTLGEVTIGKWNAYTSYSANGGNDVKNFKLYVFMILKGTKMYALFTVIPKNNSTKGKDYFFNSLMQSPTGFTQVQSNWKSYKIDEMISIKFPQEPKNLNTSSMYAKDTDTSIYVLSLVDFTMRSDKPDSAKIAADALKPAFANHFKEQMTEQLQGSNLGDVIIGKWNGHLSYSIEGGLSAKKMKIYVFVVFFGTKAYSLSAFIPKNATMTGKDYFFNSLTLN